MASTYYWLIIVLAGLADRFDGPGVISWDPVYPRSGAVKGSIEVKGIALTNKGWQVKTVIVDVWPAGGGVVEQFEVPVKGGIWGPVCITGLDATAVYNVVVDVPFSDGKERVVYRTDPRLAEAR